MAGADDDRDLAAEYALGTLDADERAAFEARLASDASSRAQVAAWQQHLAPLNDETVDIAPPTDIYAKVMERIDGSNVIQLKRRVAAWRTSAIAISAIAAALILFVSLRGAWLTSHEPVYVAVLQDQTRHGAFVAAVDLKNKVMIVRSLDKGAPLGHSYELWALGAGRAAPQPLGVIDASMRIPTDKLGRHALDDTTLAVSLEPPGGSPTGLPTGPVLFTGKLVSTE